MDVTKLLRKNRFEYQVGLQSSPLRVQHIFEQRPQSLKKKSITCLKATLHESILAYDVLIHNSTL